MAFQLGRLTGVAKKTGRGHLTGGWGAIDRGAFDLDDPSAYAYAVFCTAA